MAEGERVKARIRLALNKDRDNTKCKKVHTRKPLQLSNLQREGIGIDKKSIFLYFPLRAGFRRKRKGHQRKIFDWQHIWIREYVTT